MNQTIPTMCWSVAAKPSALGVRMHDAGFHAAKLDYKYIAIGSNEIDKVISAMRTLNVRGLGISMPHKQKVINLLEELDTSVESIGACNTVVNNENTLKGYNTDWIGAYRALYESKIKDYKTVLIVGSGGVARAFAYMLTKTSDDMDVSIAARNECARKKIASDFNIDHQFDLDHMPQTDLIINATPVSNLISDSMISNASGIFDVDFTSRNTELTMRADRIGIDSIAGWRMLLHQGAAQFELYTNQTAPLAAMESVLEQALPDTPKQLIA